MKAKNLLYLEIYAFAPLGVVCGNFYEPQISRGGGTREDTPLAKASDGRIQLPVCAETDASAILKIYE